MKELNGLTNGQAEMREFLEKIKQDADKPESRLNSPKFLTDSKKAITRLKDLKGDNFVKYDVSELFS